MKNNNKRKVKHMRLELAIFVLLISANNPSAYHLALHTVDTQ